MDAVLICGIVFYALYKIIELFVRQRSRRLMMKKMSEIPPEMLLSGIHSKYADQSDSCKSNQFVMLRLGAASLGAGIGWLLGCLLYWNQLDFFNHFEDSLGHGSILDFTFVASIALCVGIALILVYLIERKAYKEEKKGE
jgi:hypothetical protein